MERAEPEKGNQGKEKIAPFMPEGPYTPDDMEVSPERLDQIKQEVLDRLKKRHKTNVAVEMAYIESHSKYYGDDPERRAAYEVLEPMMQAAEAASRAFWKKFRIAAVALWFNAAAPHDAPNPEPGTGGFSERVQAAEELQQSGITRYQRRAYIPNLSDALEKGFMPFGYRGGGFSDMVEAYGAMFIGTLSEESLSETNVDILLESTSEASTPLDKEKNAFVRDIIHNRSDAWRFYLGIPQEHDTFGVSEFKPRVSTDDRYYYRINGFIESFQERARLGDIEQENTPIETMLSFIESRDSDNDGHVVSEDRSSGIMGNYSLSKGVDESGNYISYWDRWDLEGSVEGKEGLIGRPYEIYDRIYYDPKTYEVIQPGSKNEELADV